MGVILTGVSADAVTYHDSLAADWEQRYRKRSFMAREAVLQKCLEGRSLSGQIWLDAGCGTGTLSRWLAARGCHVLGVDASPEMIAAASQFTRLPAAEPRFERAHIEHLGMQDGSCDGLLCSSVLEYVANPTACLTEFSRVLKPGGLLLVSIPNRHSLVRQVQLRCHQLSSLMGTRWMRFLDYSRQQYSRREFQELLTQTGFALEKVLPFGSPLPRLAQRSRHWGSLLMFMARKLRRCAASEPRAEIPSATRDLRDTITRVWLASLRNCTTT
ncbi:MAG TPA: class I SAM-dependent methyltransferase [Terriglobales bacterium]|nr:class I SAM-dependent methyltransferase [Terriglobales bacterium]